MLHYVNNWRPCLKAEIMSSLGNNQQERMNSVRDRCAYTASQVFFSCLHVSLASCRPSSPRLGEERPAARCCPQYFPASPKTTETKPWVIGLPLPAAVPVRCHPALCKLNINPLFLQFMTEHRACPRRIPVPVNPPSTQSLGTKTISHNHWPRGYSPSKENREMPSCLPDKG